MEFSQTSMPVEDFYDADERRRDSSEVSFGKRWKEPGDSAVTWQLNWISDTGDLYLLRQDRTTFQGVTDAATPLPYLLSRRPVVEVVVLGKIRHRDALEDVLKGWPAAMEEETVEWVLQRTRK